MIHYRNVFGSLANDTRLNILMAINNHVAPEEETLGGRVLLIVFKRAKREKFDSCRTKCTFDGVIIENR